MTTGNSKFSLVSVTGKIILATKHRAKFPTHFKLIPQKVSAFKTVLPSLNSLEIFTVLIMKMLAP